MRTKCLHPSQGTHRRTAQLSSGFILRLSDLGLFGLVNVVGRGIPRWLPPLLDVDDSLRCCWLLCRLALRLFSLIRWQAGKASLTSLWMSSWTERVGGRVTGACRFVSTKVSIKGQQQHLASWHVDRQIHWLVIQAGICMIVPIARR